MTELPGFNKNLTLVGIDGCGGAGKSTLAEGISQRYSKSAIVHMDDFYLPSSERKIIRDIGGNFDYQRLIDQVITPLLKGTKCRYQRYDWELNDLAEWHTIEPEGMVIIEGCYSTRDEMREFYDYTIWVETPEDLRLKRGLQRDGDSGLSFWKEWMAEEDLYMEKQQPHKKVDQIVKGFS
ncbi:uridine kinase [Halobacillus sp. Marseille-Q1614]|uniref:uridine kinase family protein n=1 Tax=Halobacillus sp. Marseille-Q1614 TaxID=2709134 RepID=UPI00156DB259|nr:uridine kinase [Halobacillus sp. Marseille-Q1614]